MKNTVEIKKTTDGKKIGVFTPYNPDFVSAARNAGGRWNSDNKCWMFNSEDSESIKKICKKIYGTDGSQADEKFVALRVTVGEDGLIGHQGPAMFLGQPVASATGRDSGARVAENVVFEKGSPKSRGSVKNWKSVVPAGSVFVIKGIPEAIAIQYADAHPACTYEIINPAEIDIEALKSEKERLTARIAEINAILGE